MAIVKDIYDAIDKFAPFDTALSFDNCGLLIGGKDYKVKNCVIALDLTKDVLEYAKAKKAELIITHHPVIFGGIDSVLNDNVLYDTIKADISVISAHTNLDLADEGVNFALANKLGLSDIKHFINNDMIGKIGTLEKELTKSEFAEYVKKKLSFNVSYVDAGKEKIKTVAVAGGSGSDYLFDSKLQADAYLTGEIKHHIYTYAKNYGINLFVAGHYATEVVFAESLRKKLEESIKDVRFYVFDDNYVKSI